MLLVLVVVRRVEMADVMFADGPEAVRRCLATAKQGSLGFIIRHVIIYASTTLAPTLKYLDFRAYLPTTAASGNMILSVPRSCEHSTGDLS